MSRLISFVVGVYAGIVISQNYEIQKLPSPVDLWEKFQQSSRQFEKKDKKDDK